MDFIYRFEFPDRPPEEFGIFIDHCLIKKQTPGDTPLPSWTELQFHQCPHCTLAPDTSTHCPLAVQISDIIGKFETLISHQDTIVTVTTDNRTYTCPTTVQRALGSLLGLVMATSGCPHTTFLRPMAHFHLPVSNSEETIYRAVGVYFIGQFFRKDMGRTSDLDLSGLIDLYKNVETVNRHIIDRIRSFTSQDAPLNAIVILDYFAKNTGMAIREQLEEIRHHWSAYTAKDSFFDPET